MSFTAKKVITIADLYPDLTIEEQAEAENNLVRYLGVIKRVFDYISEQNPKILTEVKRRARLRREKGIAKR